MVKMYMTFGLKNMESLKQIIERQKEEKNYQKQVAEKIIQCMESRHQINQEMVVVAGITEYILEV